MSTTEPPIERIRTLRATVAKLTEERDALLSAQAMLVAVRDTIEAEAIQLRAQLAERDGQIAALRHWLSPQRIGDPATYLANVKQALTNTAQAAAEHDERVRAEERELLRQQLQDRRDGLGRGDTEANRLAIYELDQAIAALSTSTAGKEET